MKIFKLFGGLTFVLFNFILIMGLVSAMSEPTLFDVNSTDHDTDANLGDGICETAQGNGICTLRAAIQESNALAGQDSIMLPAGTYRLMIGGVLEDEGAFGDLDITDDLILTGNGAESTIIDGNALDRVFHIANENAAVQISGLTIRNGHLPFNRGGGGGVYNEGMLQLSDSTIMSNTVNAEGGGLSNIGSLTLNHDIITQNNATYGGGVYNAGTIDISDNTITHNTANSGAGFYNGDSNTTTTLTSKNATSPIPPNLDRAATNHSLGTTMTPTPVSTPSNEPGPSPTALSDPVSALIENSIISQNRGDGIYNLSILNLNNSEISHNSGTGLINGDFDSYNYDFGTATLNHSIVNNNGVSGLYNNSQYELTLNYSTVSDNRTSWKGGGINNRGLLTLNHSMVTANSADSHGGGIFSSDDEYYWSYDSGMLTLNHSTVSGNSVNGNGGGIYSGYELTLNHSTISDNEANEAGGAIYSWDSLTLNHSTISDNKANEEGGGEGGGIYNKANEPLTLNNSTLSGNQTNLSGGAIYHAGKEATLNLSSVTITNNTADSDGNESGDGGGLFNFIGVVNMQNTIMAANHDHSPTIQRADCSSFSVINSLGYNLMTQDLASCPVGGDTTGNLIDVDPNLGLLQDNGGPTFTHALLANSPALDAGNPTGCPDENRTLLSYDQVGLPRAWDGDADGMARCDIGAYERVSVSTIITSEGGSLTYTYLGHSTTLEVPPNAVSAPNEFSISYQTPPAMSGQLIGMDHFFDIMASQSTFNPPLTLTIRYSDTVRGTIVAGTEQLYRWQEGQWVTDGITLTHRLPNELTVQVDHLSFFGVLGETNTLHLPLMFEDSAPNPTPRPTPTPNPYPEPDQ